MKIFERIIKGNEKEIRIFGKTLYCIQRKSKMNIYGVFRYESIRSICGIPLVVSVTTRFFTARYMRGKCVQFLQEKDMLERYLPQGLHYDCVYILMNHMGESTCFLSFMLKAHLAKINAHAPLLITTEEVHIPLVQATHPNALTLHIKELRHCAFLRRYTLYRDKKVFTIYATKDIYAGVLPLMQSGKHYFQYALEVLNLSYEQCLTQGIQIPQEKQKSMRQKCAQIGLNFQNFVFLVLEANSMENLPQNFWENLIYALQSTWNGDIFVNTTTAYAIDSSFFAYKTCSLDILESFALCALSQRIIGIRCGFLEFLAQSGAPMDILYTNSRASDVFLPMRVIDSQMYMNAFSFSKVPFANKQRFGEFNMRRIGYEKVITQIQDTLLHSSQGDSKDTKSHRPHLAHKTMGKNADSKISQNQAFISPQVNLTIHPISKEQ